MWDISQKRINAAVRTKYASWIKEGYKVKASAPYWVDHEIVRIGICATPKGLKNDMTFGANFYYKEGVIK
jgi:hypothetical protein